MKKLYSLLCICLFISCSKTADENIPKDHVPDDPEIPSEIDYSLRLEVKEDTKNIFEIMEFSLHDDSPIIISDLGKAYDAIRWEIKGQEGQFRVFDYTNPANWSITSKWGHCFYSPGTYETCLVCYKNNEIVHSDTLRVQVVDRKDFLMLNWDEVTDWEHSIGYVNILNENYEMSAYARIRAGIPSVELRFWREFPDGDDMLLYDFMNSLYRAPAYDRNSSELAAKYEELFAYRKNGAQPCTIWLTDKNRIVLLNDEKDQQSKSWIYAEPQNFKSLSGSSL